MFMLLQDLTACPIGLLLYVSFHTTPTLPRHLVSKHFHHSSLSSASFVCGTVHGFQIFTSLQNAQERTKALLGMLESHVVYI